MSDSRSQRERILVTAWVTPIVEATEFWPAEAYHQDYSLKNPARYKFYVTGCGRYAHLDALWGNLRK